MLDWPVPASCRAAHLRSHSGHNAGLGAVPTRPTAPEYTAPPHLFRVLLLERLAACAVVLLPRPLVETNVARVVV